jgi:hypothetical protein
MEVQAGPGLKQDPISKITNAKGLEVWLKQYIACLARTSTIRKKKILASGFPRTLSRCG